MGFLYINPKGKEWKRHSYTAGSTFDKCPLKYKLQKVHGWKERNTWARFEFGRAFEQAIQFYHESVGDAEGAYNKFLAVWEPFKDNKELQYTKVERDWATCARIARDWLKLYVLRQPTLPIPLGGLSRFQKEVSKEVFPNDPVYGEIEDTGKLDIIAYVDPEHPMLPRLQWQPSYGPYRPLIVDIKTSGADFPEAYGMAAFDPQLRRYSWLSGIRDVALLWFVKKGLTVAKGYSVTLLENAGYMLAGQEAVVALVNDQEIWLVANDFMLEEMEKAQGEKNGKTDQTKEAKERRNNWLLANGVAVAPDQITKQRLQFNAGYVSIESAEDAGKIAQLQIIRIVNAWNTDTYPNTFGVRYPNDDRSDPYFRAFVLKDELFKKQNFKKTDEDEDLFAEDDIEGEIA